MTRLRFGLLATHVLLDVPPGDAEQAARALGTDLAAEVHEIPTGAIQSGQDSGPARALRVRGGPGAWSVDAEGSAEPAEPVDDLTAALLAALTHALVHSCPLLGVHAGVVSTADGLLVVPGASGHGKTTLVAACLRAGLGYVSDEVLAVDRVTGAVHAFPRPLALGHEVWTVLGLDPGTRPSPGGERLVPVTTLGQLGLPGPVGHVLLTVRGPDRPRLTEVGAGEAVTTLLGSSFNHFRDPAGSLHRVVAIARGARTWRVGYRDAPELAAVLRQEFGAPQSESATRSR